ncbi:GMC family oxidoreductase [Streptomyces sp. NEAU-YJ-81]|uniref:GMC family oxidoreductase n=1 Tax=Streptomyces sp. NEAU-YJ-81 TaxID=2820288 RepID=UPI001ABC6299|nr:GMC family oxidoreductase [Streptomyces sp. NEAU-YJ-81]MBO3682142.1 GMC family oxidoreductase [Streptomyces sp. NEAU-YJ-81]
MIGKPILPDDGPKRSHYDFVIVGSGMGGATLAYALKDSGAGVLLIERGDFLPQEKQNWDAEAVFEKHRYQNAEQWYDADGKAFTPGNYYYVGGNTKLYGSSLVRFRREDFRATQHEAGTSPEWPFQYDDLRPYYLRAEQLYRVHGDRFDDPTLERAEPFPYPAIGHEPPVQEAADALKRMGFTPSNIPLGIDLREGGGCIRCASCDGFPCRVLAKSDADVVAVRPAVASGSVELLTNAYVDRVRTDADGTRATGVDVTRGSTSISIDAGTVIVSCGAVNSAALLLRSANDRHPHGLGNSSGTVGRHYMVHNNTVMVALHPTRRNTAEFQKTLYFNDFYAKGTADHPYPLGHVQLIGKLQAEMLAGQRPAIPKWALRYAAHRSMDWWLFTEDLPDPENRVTRTPKGDIRIRWVPNNVRAHEILVRETRKLLRGMGYPLVFSQRTGIEVNSHQAGTVRAGTDPATSALDANCRSHEVDNLYVVDSAFFPSLPVMNPALTIAANALRVAEHLTGDTATTAPAQHTTKR